MQDGIDTHTAAGLPWALSRIAQSARHKLLHGLRQHVESVSPGCKDRNVNPRSLTQLEKDARITGT